MLDGAGRQRLQGIINRAVKRGFLPSTQPTIAEICDNADKCLFSAILKNPYHVAYCIIYCHQSNWPRIDCDNETITGNCHHLRKTHSPGKPSFPECSCLIVINTDLHSLNLSLNNNTLYKFHTYRIYCIYMSHHFCLFVNSLRMSEDNKALLTYLLTYCIPKFTGFATWISVSRC